MELLEGIIFVVLGLWVAISEWRLARLEKSAKLSGELFARAGDVHVELLAQIAEIHTKLLERRP